MKLGYKHTFFACYTGYITQAIVNTFAPLLFLTFQKTYGISLEKVTLLVTINFLAQLCVDFLSTKLVDKMGYRLSAVLAHVFSAVGIAGLGVFPEIFPTAYSGLLTAVVIYAVGGGLIEVLISPIVEATPSKNKAAAMSMLHSFYSWGCMGVISLSTLFFALLGIDNWSKLALLWAVIPALNAVYFCFVPICDILSEGQEGMTLRELFKSRLFWLLAFLMFCTGAAELSVSQWASAFAESGLGISKTAGDLAGPCLFAALMGVARVLYSKLAGRIQTEKYMSVSAVIFLLGYSLTAFSPVPALSLAGCGICGFAVGVLWPGTITVAAARCKRGGTAMFAMLALTGDLGCAAGPTLVGFVSGKFGGALSSGLMGAIIFPVLLVLGLFTLRFKDVKN